MGILAAITYPQKDANAQTYTEKVLGWTEEQQGALFGASIAMAAMIASQMDDKKHIAECIDDWYGDDVNRVRTRNSEIVETLRRFPNNHPQAVVLAVIQRECGKFGG